MSRIIFPSDNSFNYFPNPNSFISDPAALALCHSDFLDLEKFVGLEEALLLASDHEWFHNHCYNKHGIPVVKCELLQSYDNLSVSGNVYDPPIKDRLFSVINSPYFYPSPHEFLTLKEIFSLIKGRVYEAPTMIARSILNSTMQNTFIEYNFRVANFSGAFVHRSYSNLILRTDLICLKIWFDDDPYFWFDDCRTCINAYKHTIMSFNSVDQNGLIMILEANPYLSDYSDYHKYYNNLLDSILPLNVKGGNFSFSPFCFLPHDPHVFLNCNLIS